MRTDKTGNYIGDGRFHVNHEVFDFPKYPQIETSVSFSDTTESVYVTYYNNENRITCRFSHHQNKNNAVKFGDQLDGYLATELEVLYRLGLATREFIPSTYLSIKYHQIKKVLVQKYEMADKTIHELYQLGEGADLSEYTGKVAKDSNYLITGNTITLETRTRTNIFGNTVKVGEYVYSEIN